MQKLGSMTLKDCWYNLFAFLIPFICISGVTFFPYYLRTPLLLTVPFVSLLISVANTKKITLNLLSGFWFIVAGVICVSCFYSYDKDSTLEGGIVFIASSVLLFLDYPEKVWQKVMTVTNVFVVVFALSIVASVVIDDLIAGKLWFIVNPLRNDSTTAQIQREVGLGVYSGLSGEAADASLTMNVGLGILFAKFFSGEKLKKIDYAEFVLVAVALILTGKRMLFLIPIVLFVVMMLISHIKGKFVKFVAVVILAVSAILLLSAFIPQMSVLYEKFFQDTSSKYYDPLSRRGELWRYCFMMFEDSPLFGLGYASYNDYAYNHGYLRNGERWDYYGHNCYYELLGEVGIIGAVAIFGLLIFALVITVKYLRSKDLPQTQRVLLMFSFYIQAMLFIYCASGNVLYYENQIFLWFVAMSILLCVHKSHAKKKSLFNTNERLYVNG